MISKPTERRKTRLPIAFVFGLSPERNKLQISTGRVTSKRDSRNEMINSSQLNVIDKNNAARIEGISIGAVISSIT
jgi:hypothetical protein